MELSMNLLTLFMAKFVGNFIIILLFISCIYLLMNYPIWNYFCSEMVYHLNDNVLSQLLCSLAAWVTVFMVVASSFQQVKTYLYLELFIFLFVVLWGCLKINSIILFYFLFEVALIPIFLMILGWGYQPERLMASINLFLYTVFASLPLLVCFILMSKSYYTTKFSEVCTATSFGEANYLGSLILTVALILSFMVKYPLFSAHLWLPKAHVEAPVAGSMVLAAILLKLGGYGLLRMSPMLFQNFIFIQFISSFALIGGGLISVLCLRQTDLKTLIAYSSVAHMSLVIVTSLSQSFMGYVGSILLMIAHGVTSSGMFSAANVVYERWKTRNILLSKSIMNYMPIFTLWWFLLCICNMGAPPSLNLISEIISILTIANFSPMFFVPLTPIIGLAVAYNLLIYSSSQQGQLNFSKIYFNTLSFRETSLLSAHAFSGMSLTVFTGLIF